MTMSLRPRLVSLEAFSGALLVALGLAPLGCASDVVTEDGGGADAAGGASPAGPSGSGGESSASTTFASATAASGTSSGTSASGSSTSGQGGSTSVASSGSGGSGGGTGGCVDPQPVVIDGQDTGFDRCAAGQLRRREANECPRVEAGPDSCCGPCQDGYICNTEGEAACWCVPACSTDADCGQDEICMCTLNGGTCAPASCTDAGDCGPDQDCTSWDSTLGCNYPRFDCSTPDDTCGGDLDCNGQLCAVQADGQRACADWGCAVGRPFLIDDAPRTAALAPRADWADDATTPASVNDPELRARLATEWERTARMEHASIAAFARFSLQLLALGAPADLLERTHRAIADETRHARLAFAVAGAYRGRSIGPGPLALDGALDGANDVATFVRLLVREGCVGETVASLEAAECAATADDPAIHQILGVIAADEADHAELAWRAARWAVDALGDEARLAVLAELDALEHELEAGAPGAPGASDHTLLRHGVATDAIRAGFRREALRRAIVPCLRALAGAPGAARRADAHVVNVG